MRLDIGVPGVADMKCVTLWLFDGRLALRVSFEGGNLSPYARCHAAKCYYS